MQQVIVRVVLCKAIKQSIIYNSWGLCVLGTWNKQGNRNKPNSIKQGIYKKAKTMENDSFSIESTKTTLCISLN